MTELRGRRPVRAEKPPGPPQTAIPLDAIRPGLPPSPAAGAQPRHAPRPRGRPIRIWFLIRDSEIGGAERQLIVLAKGLHQRGHDVSVVTFYPGGGFWPELNSCGFKVISLNKCGRWDVVPFMFRLVRAAREARPDVVHSYTNGPNILVTLLRWLLACRKVVWGVRASDMDAGTYDWLSSLTIRWAPRLAPLADLIIANSQAGQSHLMRQGVPQGKIIVIPNGIDTARFAPDPEAGKQVRAEWGIADEAVAIGIVARLVQKKNHPAFLKAAAALRRRLPTAKFVCVGSGPRPYLMYLQEIARDMGVSDAVIWAGERTDMPAVYNALDVVCLTSAFGEGFPNAVGEAMSCGVPCIVTDNGDAALVVEDAGEVVRGDDPVQLADAMERVARRSWKRASREACRQRIEEQFSVAALIETTERALQRLLYGEERIHDKEPAEAAKNKTTMYDDEWST